MVTWKTELKETLRLAAPVTAVQVGLMAMNMVDAMMVGRMAESAHEGSALAAVNVGSFFHWMCTIWSFGVVMALDPLIAQAAGAHDKPAIARALQRGFVLTLILSVPGVLLSFLARPALVAFGQQESVIPPASSYALVNAAGIVPFLLFVALRQTLQALHRLRALLVVIVAANLLNVVLNWMLIFGHGGLPALGVAGAAWATVGSRWAMALGVLTLEWKTFREYLRPWRAESLQLEPLLRMTRLGLPIGAQMFLEFAIFGTASMLVGRHFGAIPQAGHTIALNLASFSFMFPLGVSAAAAVRVGRAIGRGDQPAARRAGWVSLALGCGIMLVFAIVYLAAPSAFAALYTDKAAVIAAAAALIPIAGVFQVFDGAQVVAIGILRGLGDTFGPAVINVIGFWVLGLPVALALGLGLDLGASGIWWGLTAGLAVVAVMLFARTRARLGQERIERIRIDGPPGSASISEDRQAPAWQNADPS